MRLIIIGDGDDRASLEELAQDTDIAFIGQQAGSVVREAMRFARAVLLPSECFETFGLTVLESMAQGTPVIVSDLGALPELVCDGKTGFVFAHCNVDACAAAIEKLISQNDATLDQMGLAARSFVLSRHTGEANFNQLQTIYGTARRVLLVHNYYGSTAPSGENKVFDAERKLLADHGLEVDVWTQHSDGIRGDKKGLGTRNWGVGSRVDNLWGLVRGALSTVANPFSAFALSRKIQEFKPGVVHFHNTFPLVSPLCLKAAHRAGCKVVMTLHNYRTVCAAGIPLRDGQVCTKCLDKKSVCDAIKHGCYRGSLIATLPLALNIWWYRKRWSKWVDTFVVLSEFQREKMIACGFPAKKLVVKGNFTEISDVPIISAAERKDEILYVGRLSREKGVFTLVEAWKRLQEDGIV